MRNVLLAVCGLVALPNGAVAGSAEIYEHNGSVVYMLQQNDRLTIRYSTPKASLAKAGVKDQTILFDGKLEPGRIVGTAYVFKAGCAPFPYEVISGADENGEVKVGSLFLVGPAPVLAKEGCEVLRYSQDSPNARLEFKFSAVHH